MIDIVTIVHNDTNKKLFRNLHRDLVIHEDGNYRMILHDNSVENLGFAKGCNEGAKLATKDIIGFLNPDVRVKGKFVETVERQFEDHPNTMITGSTFRSGIVDVSHNGLKNWVCGAGLFVRRDWFESVGGFHEGFIWSWEETDLCKQAEDQGFDVTPIVLPLKHDRSHVRFESETDRVYKDRNFKLGERLYRDRWKD